jgi:glyoxylase I family protein
MHIRLEHLGFNVPDANATAQWYIDTFGFVLVRHAGDATNNQFIADAGQHFMLQFYTRPADPMWDSPASVFTQQLALQVSDIAAVQQRLLQAGATSEVDLMQNASGDTICFLRDPFGIALELVQRVETMLSFDG